MPALTFAVTWDYRCPFARNAHEHLLDALEGGAHWDVTFVPFSLGQVHVAEGEPDIWETPEKDSGLLALQAGRGRAGPAPRAVPRRPPGPVRRPPRRRPQLEGPRRDRRRAHEQRRGRRRPCFAEIAEGWPLETIRKEHEAAANDHTVWGVPTFISGERAVFVRLMDRPQGDAAHATRSVERVIDLLDGWPELNEFKWTVRTK